MSSSVLSIKGITKRFGSLVANSNISVELKAGEILGLLGENGAGKSTLMSILFGHYMADEGCIEVMGKPLAPGRPSDALKAGVGMVHQHFTLADNLTVLENVMLGTESFWKPWSSWRTAQKRVLAVARQFGLEIDPQARISSLSVGERQRVEIIKALYRGAKILILDEPTSVLTPQESENLFKALDHWVTQGLSVIFISHKLGEVLRVCDRVAVLRSGALVAESTTDGLTQSQLAQWMVGHAVAEPRRQPACGRVGQTVCLMDGVTTAIDQGAAREALRGVSLDIKSGEMVAIAGVSGNGQSTLCNILFGTASILAGRVLLAGQALPGNPSALVAMGVARIPEDRQAIGLVGDLPVWQNIISERLRSQPFSKHGWIDQAAAMVYASDVIQTFDIRGARLDTPARNLSGGNMQKLILGRALMSPARNNQVPLLIVAHQPTWGLDVGAISFVHQQLLAARDKGAAVLLISDDLDEVMTLGDRIAVMFHGQLTAALPASQWDRPAIGMAMAGLNWDTRAI